MICDAHVHVGSPASGRLPPEAAPGFVAGLLKGRGVDEFIFSSLDSQLGASFGVVEREAIETKEAFGEGAHAFLWLAGRFFDADPDLGMLDSGLWEGVKLHGKETPWLKERPRDLERILSVLEERGLPVQFHAGEDAGCYPHELLPFVLRHPGLRADFAHCRPSGEAIRCLRECPRLFADTSFMAPELYPAFVAAGVADRLMFGTDFPAHVACYEGSPADLYGNDIAGAREYGFSETVMCGNFHRFLHGDTTGANRPASTGGRRDATPGAGKRQGEPTGFLQGRTPASGSGRFKTTKGDMK